MSALQPVNEQLGYCFHPPQEAHTIGHPQLDVVLRPAPTGEHFDPESFMCLVATPNGATRLHITHSWTLDTMYRVCAGDVLIEDRLHERLQAFTFGGTLHIDSDARRTICRLISPAPLLEHTQQMTSLEEYLIEEVCILFAERRAAQDDDVLEQRLSVADPLQLYQACLAALRAKFEHFPAADDTQRRLKQFLHSTAHSQQAEAVPALAELL